MRRLLLSTLLAFSATVSAKTGAQASATTNLTLVKNTKYNVVGAVFAGRSCLSLDLKKVKAVLEKANVKIEGPETTLDKYITSLRSVAQNPLEILAAGTSATPGECVLQDIVVLGRFPNNKQEIEDVTHMKMKVGTPICIVAYKKSTLWNPKITTKSLLGYNSNPTYFNASTYNGDKYDQDTYVTLSTEKSGGLLGGKDGGLKIELSNKKTAEDLIGATPSVGKVKFSSVPERVLKSGLFAGLTAADYAAGITIKAVGITIPVVFGAVVTVGSISAAVATLGYIPGSADPLIGGIGAAKAVAKGPNKLSSMIKVCFGGSDGTCRTVKAS